jgi:hypothetical protein
MGQAEVTTPGKEDTPTLVGTARYGPVRRVVWDPWLTNTQSRGPDLLCDEAATIRLATVQIQYLLESKWRIYRVLEFQLAALRFLHRIGQRRRRLPQYYGQGSKDALLGSQYLAMELEYPVFRRSPVWQCVRPLDSLRPRRRKRHESWSIAQQTPQHPASLFRGNEFALYSLCQCSCPQRPIGRQTIRSFFPPGDHDLANNRSVGWLSTALQQGQ